MPNLSASVTSVFNDFLESLSSERPEAIANERGDSPSQLMKKEVLTSEPKVSESVSCTERLSIENKGEKKNYGDDGPESSPAKENEEANAGACSATSLLLTEEEEQDNKKWKIRFLSEDVFTQQYDPTWWERREMNSIVEFLALKNPIDHPEFLNKDDQQVTKAAIGSIFFPLPQEGKSVLLKRGPVLIGGEERELMLFTRGFMLSRVEMISLLNILLDESPAGPTQRRTSEYIRERFRLIDADMGGSIDRSEIQDFFRGMGMTLSETILDKLMAKLDSDSDGTISLDEFKSALYELQNPTDDMKSSWNRILRFTLSGFLEDLDDDLDNENCDTQNLDVAFQMSDIETIDTIVEESTPSALAVYPKGERTPLLVDCAKPGHVDAWGEAFGICMQMRGEDGSQRDKCRRASSDFSRIDWG